MPPSAPGPRTPGGTPLPPQDRTQTPSGPGQTTGPAQAPGGPAQAPGPVQGAGMPAPAPAPRPARMSGPTSMPGPSRVPGPVRAPMPAPVPEPVTEVLPGPVPGLVTTPGTTPPGTTPPGMSGGGPRRPAPEPDDRSTAVLPAVRDDETVGLRVTGPSAAAGERPPGPTGGRAERRKAAKGRGRKGAPPAEPVIPAIPRTRMEARLAARALKDSPAVIASRAIGEVFISLGVLMLLFVTYQLWWTNVRAHEEANGTAHSLQDNWAKGGDKKAGPGAFEPGQGFAIIHIPKLDVVVPIAEGVSKTKVLDRGMVGHYSEGKLKTAMPSAKTGNFALAGHRNTHGEPFRYINKLQDGDKVVVETQDDYYTYEVTSHLAQTSPSNVSVIQPVPVGSGFTGPGRYITLTTCTPEFTSTYRMVVWGKMVDERPRSKGMPAALTAG
ncbi:class E sortase [Streptomyces sp. NBC_00388]|uniref:class E sortase n=1 Tax=Streptomyces sp. NBC_00388 TaxID=2975735 RepID=UPI003FA6FC0A